MKVIDEKGRLFGKINIIDFFVIIFLVSLIPMFYFGYRLSNAKKLAQRALEAQRALGAQQVKKFVKIEIFGNLIEVPPYLLKSITIGDKETNEKGEGIGEITWIGEPGPFKYTYNLGEDENAILKKIELEDPELKQLLVKFNLMAEVRGADLYHNGQIIKLVSPFVFKTYKYSVKVMPIDAGPIRVDKGY